MNQPLTYSVTLSFLPFADNYTFSAKEKDVETGLSYFGSRYYSSDLSIWLSVDPMSDKYPSLSPYTYCANNPVKLVDPNGEEVGQYWDWDGNYLGSDGKVDLDVYFVSDEKSINTIKNNDNAGGTTKRSDVTVDWETNLTEISTILSVYDKTVFNGGEREEAATFSRTCGFPKFYPTGDENGEIDIDHRGYLSIHSHKLKSFTCPDGVGICVQTPNDLSDKDKGVFPNYVYNVVVGNSYEFVTNYRTGAVHERREGTAVIYDSNCNMIGKILIDNLRNIKF
jgi:RHS repeat-associated protein